MISVGEAKILIGQTVPEPITETVSLADASDRILANELRAPFPQPRFTNSAMDGFAVHTQDLKGATHDHPITLPLHGVIAAGTNIVDGLPNGTCMQIMTGAPLPEGADAVVMVEDTSGFDEAPIAYYKEPVTGQHIRWQGEEVTEGEELVPTGTRITPDVVGALATAGAGEVEVYRRPKVAILGTGNELVEPGKQLVPGQIYNSNVYVLTQLAARCGAEVVSSGVIGDDQTIIRATLEKALSECDIVITTGGVSMGRFDYVKSTLLEIGVQEHFWKVAEKPGKPLFFATLEGTMIFGLPGNPVSAFILFMEYVWPVVEQIQCIKPSKKCSAVVAEKFAADPKKHRFVFGNAWWDHEQLMAQASNKQGSHMLTSALNANCIIEAPPNPNPLGPGDKVTVSFLPWVNLPMRGEE